MKVKESSFISLLPYQAVKKSLTVAFINRSILVTHVCPVLPWTIHKSSMAVRNIHSTCMTHCSVILRPSMDHIHYTLC